MRQQGLTALILAALNDRVRIVTMLLEAGAHLETRSDIVRDVGVGG